MKPDMHAYKPSSRGCVRKREKEGERGYGERVTAEGLGGMGLLERERTHSIESTFCREHIL